MENPPAPVLSQWSGREDLNLRPPAPKAGALPGCATPRLHRRASSLYLRASLAYQHAGTPIPSLRHEHAGDTQPVVATRSKVQQATAATTSGVLAGDPLEYEPWRQSRLRASYGNPNRYASRKLIPGTIALMGLQSKFHSPASLRRPLQTVQSRENKCLILLAPPHRNLSYGGQPGPVCEKPRFPASGSLGPSPHLAKTAWNIVAQAFPSPSRTALGAD